MTPSSEPKPNVSLIVDAGSLYARSFFAMSSLPVPEQQPAAIVATRTLLRLLNCNTRGMPFVPSHLLMCWDGERKNVKNREPKPSGYHEERERFLQLTINLFDAEQAQPDFSEADDAVATAALRREEEGDVVIVASGDKDMEQLVGPRLYYWSLNKREIITRQDIMTKWGVKRPIQMALALAIIGDRVDNIPGVSKVGKVRCTKLLEAITPAMTLCEAKAAVSRQLTRDQIAQFEESLELTLLDSCLQWIPDPRPIRLVPPSDLGQYEAESLRSDYLTVYCQRTGTSIDEYYSIDIP